MERYHDRGSLEIIQPILDTTKSEEHLELLKKKLEQYKKATESTKEPNQSLIDQLKTNPDFAQVYYRYMILDAAVTASEINGSLTKNQVLTQLVQKGLAKQNRRGQISLISVEIFNTAWDRVKSFFDKNKGISLLKNSMREYRG